MENREFKVGDNVQVNAVIAALDIHNVANVRLPNGARCFVRLSDIHPLPTPAEGKPDAVRAAEDAEVWRGFAQAALAGELASLDYDSKRFALLVAFSEAEQQSMPSTIASEVSAMADAMLNEYDRRFGKAKMPVGGQQAIPRTTPKGVE